MVAAGAFNRNTANPVLSVSTVGDERVPRSLVNATFTLAIGEPFASVKPTSTRLVFSAGRRMVSLQPVRFAASTQDNVVIFRIFFSPESGLGTKVKSSVLVMDVPLAE